MNLLELYQIQESAHWFTEKDIHGPNVNLLSTVSTCSHSCWPLTFFHMPTDVQNLLNRRKLRCEELSNLPSSNSHGLNIGSTIRNQYKVQLLRQVFPCGLEKPRFLLLLVCLHRHGSCYTVAGWHIRALTPEEKTEACIV